MALKARIQPLFATPLIIANLDDEELRSSLEASILAKRAEDPGVKRSNVGGWHSDLRIREWGGEAARKLIEEAVGLANSHTVRPAGSGDEGFSWRAEGWANVNESGAVNMRHVHGACYWSAVYYVRVDEGTGGELVLHDLRMPTLAMHAPTLRFKGVGPEREAHIKPEVGALILFPAWLPHEVRAWNGDGMRVSIAINISAVSRVS
jgi:uncharacterized protein (TIGR02466 family)